MFNPTPPPLKLAIMASGRGSNFEAIYQAIQTHKLNAKIILLLSDQAQAKAITSAQEKKIPTVVCSRQTYPTKAVFEEALIEAIRQTAPDLVVLAGYMKILSPSFISAFENKIVNIHPALLPAFPGLDGQKQALDYGVKIAGCTVHFVDSGVDTGPIIMQQTVPVLDDDTEETLSLRILKEEHNTYWRAIKLIADGRVRLEGRKVSVTN